jgi:hypothetical protein
LLGREKQTYVPGFIVLEVADGEFTIKTVIILLGETVVP